MTKSIQAQANAVVNIAHLSDLHIGWSPARDAFIEKRLCLIGEANPDHLIISGDLSASGQPAEFSFLVHILQRLGYNSSERLTVIPGNHDLFSFFFKDFQVGSDFYSKLRHVPNTALQIFRYDWSNYKTDLAHFLTFFQEAFQNILTLNGANPGHPFPFIKIINDRVAIVALESNQNLPQVRHDAFCSGGYVDPVSTRHILAHASLDDKCKIVVLHHHLLPDALLRGREGRMYASMTRIVNRLEIVRLFSHFNVDLVLHGHYHRQEEYRIGNDIKVLNNGDFQKWSMIQVDGHQVTISGHE